MPTSRTPNPFDVEAREYLGTPKSEAAVRRALDWLASRQQADGHWASAQYQADTAISGLCALAFMAAGHQPGRGKYGTKLTATVDWLADAVRRNGLIYVDSGSAGPQMYDHGFATLALAELYGMTKRSDLRPKLEAAVRLIVGAQNTEGGWRYQPNSADADISVTAAQIVALRAAHNAGVRVPEETVRKGLTYIKGLVNEDGGYRYQRNRSGSGPARTGAAVTCLALSGEKESAECKAGVKYIVEHPINRYESAYREWYLYAYYYCTQAMYQIGGDPWKEWFTVVRDRLVAEQKPDGFWNDRPGQEYATAMAVLVLQVPAGLLPIYQK